MVKIERIKPKAFLFDLQYINSEGSWSHLSLETLGIILFTAHVICAWVCSNWAFWGSRHYTRYLVYATKKKIIIKPTNYWSVYDPQWSNDLSEKVTFMLGSSELWKIRGNKGNINFREIVCVKALRLESLGELMELKEGSICGAERADWAKCHKVK